jgi:hypothetical protein
VQAAAQAALTAAEVQAANAVAGAHHSTPAVLASDFAAFPGCWQVVLHLVLPQQELGQQLQGEAAEQQLQQALQAAAQEVAAAWPQSGGLVGMQLGQQQQQHAEVHVHSFAAAAGRAAMQDQLIAAAAAEAGAPAGHAEAYVLNSLASVTGLEAAAAGFYLQPVVLPGNSSSSGDGVTAVELCIAPAALQLLQAVSQHNLRVVVAASRSDAFNAVDAGCGLLDQAWELSNAPPGAAGEACVPLQLQLPATFEPQLLSVVVLQDASTAAADEGQAAAAAEAANDGDASAAVLAKLPLLVLPPAAAEELQGLYTGLTAEQGLPPAAAYQEVLPLLQDLASVVSNTQHGSCAAQHQLHRAMLSALEECFEANGMEACQQLLALLDASAAAAAAAADDGAASVQAEPTAAQPAAAAAAPRCSTAAKDTEEFDEAAGQAVHSQHLIRNNNSTRSSSGSSSCCSASCDSVEGSTSAASTPAMAALHVCDAGAVPGSACQVSALSVLFGFPSAAAQAYASFKCTHMVKLDFLCMMIYAIGLVPTVRKFLLMLAQGSSTIQLLAAAFRALFVAIAFATRALVWAAGMWPHRLGFLHRWRNMLLIGSLSAILLIPTVGVLYGGMWRAASLAAMDGYYSLPLLLVVYRHFVEPALVCIGFLPSLFFLVQCVLVADPMFGRPQVFGASPVHSAVLLAGLHLVLAAKLEVGMQRKFAHHVARSRSHL